MAHFCFSRLYLGIDTFLSSVATGDNDGHGLKVGPTFSIFNATT